MKVLVLFVLALCVCANSYRILVLYAQPIRSLNILGKGVVKHLLNAGHEVTYVTAFPTEGKRAKNYNEIDLSSLHGVYETDEADVLNISYVMANNEQTNDISLLLELGLQISVRTLQDKNMQDLLLDKTQQFDAVVIDYLDTEVYAGIAAIYECPIIWGYSMGPNSISIQLVDEPTNPAYTADFLSSNIPPFNLQQRVEELWKAIVFNYNKWFKIYPKHKEAYNKIFGPIAEKLGRKLPKYEDIVYNSSLVLSNFHYGTGNIPNLPQNYKMIGGYYIDRPAKPLTSDLQNLIDNAKHGVIYFSMGSTWKSKDIPKSVTEGLLKVFGELKQTVIWKYEEDLPNVPKNIHIIKWAPQQSVLAHPNVLFFITHGGLLSSTETIHFAVPQIGIPIYYDQFINVNRAVANGYAIRVDLNFDLPKNLKVAIDTMLKDPTYKERVKHLSSLYHDRPIEPSTEMVWWIEHVIRTGGALHLSPPSHSMPWYQKLYLDLLAIVLITIVLIIQAGRLLFKEKNKNQYKTKKFN